MSGIPVQVRRQSGSARGKHRARGSTCGRSRCGRSGAPAQSAWRAAASAAPGHRGRGTGRAGRRAPRRPASTAPWRRDVARRQPVELGYIGGVGRVGRVLLFRPVRDRAPSHIGILQITRKVNHRRFANPPRLY